MPTYQYRCTECGTDLEAVQKFSDAALTECPTCHGALRKVYNAVGVVFKGSGFYRTDSRPKEGSAEGGPNGSGDAKGKDAGSNGSSEKKSPDAKGSSEQGSGSSSSGSKKDGAKSSAAASAGSGSSGSSGSSTGAGASS